MDKVGRVSVKVPEITAYFWVIKLLSTAAGEAIADYTYFRDPDHPVPGVTIELVLFLLALIAQLRWPRYFAPVYWFAVLMVAVFGTTLADFVDYVLLVPLPITSVVLAALLALVMWRWRTKEGTLSIHAIDTASRERYYWATVFVTFMLGTAVGDMTADTFHLGFLVSGIAFAVLFFATGLAHRRLGWNGVLSFWIAYILTRPFGASFADWFGKARSEGGLGVGSGSVSVVLVLAIVLLVGYVTAAGRSLATTRRTGR